MWYEKTRNRGSNLAVKWRFEWPKDARGITDTAAGTGITDAANGTVIARDLL